jgi:acetylornithine deacetylase
MPYPKLEQMMQELIAAPSVSSVSSAWDQSNQKVIELLETWCARAGFSTEVLEIPDKPGKYNLIASSGDGNDGLVLSGHTDTVPYDEGRWSQNPFQLTERDNRWYGLGTADMKGFFAVMLEAVRSIKLNDLQKPLILLATADEESSMDGARALVQKQRRLGAHAVIGEPTGLKPIRMHKSISMEAIRITGQSGHSSNPALGKNAMEGMHQVMDEIMRWREELQQRYANPLFAVPQPTLNLGYIHGGDNPNRICGHCEMHFDIRALPGMPLDDLRAELDRRLGKRLIDSGLQIQRAPLFHDVPAMETPAAAAIVKTAEQLTGYTAEAVAFATEGPFLNQLGMQTVILGPGSIDQAHQPDEYISLEQIQLAIQLVRDLVARFCLKPS